MSFSAGIKGSDFKDRQQEAERGLRYLNLFCRYCMHINILYMKLKIMNMISLVS